MKIRLGTNVFSEDGDKVGVVKAVIIEPLSREVTHLVLQEGLLFKHDCLLPIASVESASESAVCLNRTASDLHELINNYQDTDFITVAEPEGRVPEKTWARPGGLPLNLVPPGIAPGELSTDVSIPMEDISLVHGASVQTGDGKLIGTVLEVLTDENETISQLLIRTNGIYGQAKLIPLDWIAAIDENTVKLAVNAAAIRDMADYEPETR